MQGNAISTDTSNTQIGKQSYENAFVFQEAFEDKRLGLKLYAQNIVDGTLGVVFPYNFVLSEHARSVGKSIESVLCVVDDILEESSDSLYKSGEALLYGTTGIVSNRVFLNYGFPDVVSSDQDQEYFSLNASYFSFLESGDEIQNKNELCTIFESTKTFAGRKFLIEEIFPKNIREYEVFSGIKYSLGFDEVFRDLMNRGDMQLRDIFDIISHSSYNLHELELHFQLLHICVIEKPEISAKEIISFVSELISGLRASIPIDASGASRIFKTAIILRLSGKEISKENISSHLGVYTYIPSILSSTHGEDSGSIGLLKGFVKSHRPPSIKGFDKHKKWVQALIADFQVLPGVKRLTARAKIGFNRYMKLAPIEKISSALTGVRNSFGEKKMDIFINRIRKTRPEEQGELSHEEHKELMKHYFLLERIVAEVQKDVQVNEGRIEKTLKSRVLKFILGRGKTESIGPFATQAWLIFTRFPLIGKLMALIPVMKFLPLLLIVKTSFIYFFYKLVDIGIFMAKKVPFMERSIRFASVNGAHGISVSPKLHKLMRDELDSIRDINKNISEIQRLKRLRFLRSRLESNLYDAKMTDNGVELSQQDQYEIALLEAEIGSLEGEIDSDELGKEIVDLKIRYLDILTETGINSRKSFSEGYIE